MQHINADENIKCLFPGRPFPFPRCTTGLQHRHTEAKPHEQQHGGRAWPGQHINAGEDCMCVFPGRLSSSSRCTTKIRREQQTAVGPGPGNIEGWRSRVLVPGATFFTAPVHCLIPALPQEGIAEEEAQGPEAGWGPGEARDVLARLLSPAAPLCLLLRLEGSSTAPGGSRCTSSTTAVNPGPINTDVGNTDQY